MDQIPPFSLALAASLSASLSLSLSRQPRSKGIWIEDEPVEQQYNDLTATDGLVTLGTHSALAVSTNHAHSLLPHTTPTLGAPPSPSFPDSRPILLLGFSLCGLFAVSWSAYLSAVLAGDDRDQERRQSNEISIF